MCRRLLSGSKRPRSDRFMCGDQPNTHIKIRGHHRSSEGLEIADEGLQLPKMSIEG